MFPVGSSTVASRTSRSEEKNHSVVVQRVLANNQRGTAARWIGHKDVLSDERLLLVFLECNIPSLEGAALSQHSIEATLIVGMCPKPQSRSTG